VLGPGVPQPVEVALRLLAGHALRRGGVAAGLLARGLVPRLSLARGRGGVAAGVLLLSSIAPALVFLHLQPQWEKALQGLIILLAVAADGWRSVRRKH